jgi:hypothetical protein
MKYEDFSALVQLGVGLHLGTALLQLYGEIGVQPLIRAISRIKRILDDKKDSKILIEELTQLEVRFEIFRIRLFNEFKKYIVINSIVAALLGVALVAISYKANDAMPHALSILIAFGSILPAPITVGVLWHDASKQLKPLKIQADKLEQAVLKKYAAEEPSRPA